MKFLGINRTIHTRKSWGARTPKPRTRTRQAPTRIQEFFVHWPGSKPKSWSNVNTVAEEQATMRSIQNFHMGPERNWSDFAYSFAIFPSGRIYRGRGNTYVPAAQLGHNTNTLAVCVFLGPDDTIPTDVKNSLKWLIKYSEQKSGHGLRVRPHKAVTSTECPGPRLSNLITELDRV